MENLLNEKISETENLKLEKRALEEELTPLKKELERIRDELKELRNNPTVIFEEPSDNDTDSNDQTDSSNVQPIISSSETERLREIEKEYNALKSSYYEYVTKENDVLKEKGEEGLVQSKIYLDIFLASSNIENIFEGLRDRIKMYDIAFEKVGREIAFMDVKDLIYDLSLLESKREKLSFLDSELKSSSGNKAYTELINELIDFVEENT
jgi:hypothetical protein